MEKKNIVLIGMPAVGKSTLGILLAKKLCSGFFDTDILIQTGEGKTLPEIIETGGVQRFLSLEENYLMGLNLTNHVIATGGSAVYSRRAMMHLSTRGYVVYLEIGLDHLKKRLSSLDKRGVVRTPGQDIDSLYFERTPLYNRYSDLEIQCGSLPPDQVLATLLTQLTEAGVRGLHMVGP